MEKAGKSWNKFLDLRSSYGSSSADPGEGEIPRKSICVTSELIFGSIPQKSHFLLWNDLGQNQIPGIGDLLPAQALPTWIQIRSPSPSPSHFSWMSFGNEGWNISRGFFPGFSPLLGQMEIFFCPFFWFSSLDFPPSPGIFCCLLILACG